MLAAKIEMYMDDKPSKERTLWEKKKKAQKALRLLTMIDAC
jgi:hypothetical protein